MPEPRTNGRHPEPPPANGSSREQRFLNIAELIDEAEKMRAQMQDSFGILARLIAGLKWYRRQSRVMRSAMESLSQIKLDG